MAAASNAWGTSRIGPTSSEHRTPSPSSPVGCDSINNVEAVFIPPNEYPTGSSITISMIGQDVTTASPQQFAVYAYNVKP